MNFNGELHRDLDGIDRATQRASTLTAWPTQSANDEIAKPAGDWKRTVLIAGLGLLSWVATYVGMLELIEANMGDLPIIHRMIIGFSVAMLMIMVIWLLDQLFKPHPFITKLFYAIGYVFLTLISVGFGFGFYWKVLESRGEASRSAESAVSQVQNSLQAASTRLEQLQATLVQLTSVSNEKAEIERTKGTSCPNSKPGDGPRRKMRDEDAQRFTFASEFVKGRVGAVKGDLSALDVDLLKITTADASTFDAKTGTRNEFMRALGRKLDLTVTGFNAFRTDPQLRQIRSDLADRAERSTVTDQRGAAISCPDAQLQTALRGVVKAIDQLPVLSKPEIAAVEGSEATIEAFRRLTTTFYGLLAFKMPPSADELRELQKRAVQSVEGTGASGQAAGALRVGDAEQGGLSKRDYVPLAVALFVDLCLLLVSMVQRPNGRLAGLLPKMQAAERGPVIQILSRFNEIHRDRQVRENFEIFRHVVFDMHGDYYVAVPLDAPPRLNPEQREALRVEAQLLANLFASFEKEKIFKRTMLPTTSSIQKRLARQGSKFAGSEAFRVYKFSDGAWSDIILGAVMGAARRIEHQERASSTMAVHADRAAHGERATQIRHDVLPPARTVETEPTEPTLTTDASAPASVFTSPRRERSAASGSTSSRGRGASRAGRQPAPQPVDPEHETRFGPYAQVYQPAPPAYATAPQGPRVPWPAPQPLPEAEVEVIAATGHRAHTRETSSDEARVVPMSRAVEPSLRSDATHERGQDRQRAHVTLSRETATITLPVSEAVLPASLQSALSGFASLRSPASIDTDTTLHRHNEILTSRQDAANDDDFTVSDLALIGRMAPPAAE
ncbi:MAG: hypothetical protein K2X41_03460 [Hyphomicrobium sp.]|nr:hypothetical protein [Hyphomicrobium sp.]